MSSKKESVEAQLNVLRGASDTITSLSVFLDVTGKIRSKPLGIITLSTFALMMN